MTHPNLETILKRLVNVPSVTKNFVAAEKVIDEVEQMLTLPGVQQKRGKVNDYPYLLASTQKSNKDTLWFVSHLDVVPADKSMFKLTSDDKNYYGRGVFDMKGMAAAHIAAFIKLKDKSDCNVAMMFTTDEEVGGRNGVGALVDSNFKGAAAIVLDQSNEWVLQEKMKGILWLEITVKGKTAHGARPWLGDSANQKMVHYLEKLKTWYDGAIDKNQPERYYTSFNLGTLHGGEAPNQVNDSAVAVIDVRYTSESDAKLVLDNARRLATEFEGIFIETPLYDPCVETDPTEYWFQKVVRAMKELGLKPGTNGERFGAGSTDGRYFAPYNIPVIGTRSPGGGQHSAKEWLEKDGLQQMQELCSKLMEETRA